VASILEDLAQRFAQISVVVDNQNVHRAPTLSGVSSSESQMRRRIAEERQPMDVLSLQGAPPLVKRRGREESLPR
jgi:hypothetical protein